MGGKLSEGTKTVQWDALHHCLTDTCEGTFSDDGMLSEGTWIRRERDGTVTEQEVRPFSKQYVAMAQRVLNKALSLFQ